MAILLFVLGRKNKTLHQNTPNVTRQIILLLHLNRSQQEVGAWRYVCVKLQSGSYLTNKYVQGCLRLNTYVGDFLLVILIRRYVVENEVASSQEGLSLSSKRTEEEGNGEVTRKASRYLGLSLNTAQLAPQIKLRPFLTSN